ncbi:MAG: redoxin domain-containing protein [Planctomycetota bacterium]|nr:redoxin domain-containing protein [Planctomycetota bacterium]
MTTSLPEEIPVRPSPRSVLRSLVPLLLAAMFMVAGILVLVYLGRDTARLMNAPLGDLDLAPLVDASPLPALSEMQGQVLVFHFWGTWGTSSKGDFREYATLFSAYKNHAGVKFLTVSCSPGVEENLEKLRDDTVQFMHNSEARIPNYADPAMYTRGRIAKMLSSGGFQYPMTLIVDQKGIVREFWLGSDSDTMLQVNEAIKKLLAEKPSESK